MSDYLIDFVYLNPPRILDKAIWEITDSILDVNKLTEVRLSVLGTLASYYGEELTGGLIEKITGEVMKDISEYVTGTQTVP